MTGPGLPAYGVTLVAQLNQTWFSISTTNPNCSSTNSCNNNWLMSDTDIGKVLPNSVYTIKLYSNAASPALLATYTEVVPVAPVFNNALATFAFPTISGMVNLAGKGDATLTPSWTTPSGLSAAWLNVHVWQAVTYETMNVEAYSLISSSGTATLVLAAPPNGGVWTYGGYGIGARDQNGGEVRVWYQ